MVLAVGQGEMNNLIRETEKENWGWREHAEIISMYIIDGMIQSEIQEYYGLSSDWIISSIVRAYNFNPKGGKKSRGQFDWIDREMVDEYVNTYFPGFVDDDSYTFEDFLADRGIRDPRAGNNSSRSSAAKTHSTFDIPEQPYRDDNSRMSERHGQKRVSHAGDSGSLPKISIIIGAGLLCVYLLWSMIVEPIFHQTKSFVSNIDLEIPFISQNISVTHLQLEDGAFVGEVEKGKPDGYGKWTDSTGAVYAGKMAKGKKEEYGLIQDNGTITFVGGFHKNKYHGIGMLQLENGEQYIGNFKNGKKHGVGAVLNQDQSIHLNEYKRDKLAENIAVVDLNTGGVYFKQNKTEYQEFRIEEGYFLISKMKKNDLYDFTVEVAPEYLYFGIYEDNRPDGEGVKVFPDGTVEFGNRSKKGMEEGILITAEGMIMGEFKNRRIHGKGMEYFSTGEIYIGNYKEALRDGKGVYVYSNGTAQEMKY